MRPRGFNNLRRASSPNSVNRVRYMPDRTTIVTAAQAARMRTPEQLRVLSDPRLNPMYFEWHNGGGLVHVDADVHPNSFVGLCAIVDEHARLGKYAVVAGSAQVDGTVVHEGCVDGDAVVEEGGRVQDYAHVTGSSYITKGACIGGHVQVGGSSIIGDNVKVGGGFTICMTDPHFVLEDFIFVLGSNIVISDVAQIAALEAAMSRQVQ